MRNPPTIKLKKHENICHLQPNAWVRALELRILDIDNLEADEE